MQLAFSPCESENSQSAENHYQFLLFVLELFGKSIENVVALEGDNRSANKAFAIRVGCGFVGCASHRYNLAMKDILQEEQIVIQKVRELIRDYMTQVELEDIDDLLLTPRQDKAIDRVKLRIADLDPITKAFQLDSATIADRRAYFDEVIAEYPV